MKLNGQVFNIVTIVDDDGHLQKFETKDLFKINKDQLTAEMLKFSEDFGWWGRLAAEVGHQKRQLKATLDQTEAQVSISVRKGGVDGDVKLTEKTVEAMIAIDPLLKKATDDYNEVCRLHDIVISVVDTLRVKHDMIKLYTNQ